MKKEYSLFILLFFLFTSTVNGQNKSIRLGFEASINGYGASMKEPYRYKEALSNYYSFTNEPLTPILFQPTFALKIEKPFFDGRLSIASGIRYSCLSGYTSSGDAFLDYYYSDIFYVLLEDTPSDIIFVSINSVKIVSHYVGIPLDIQYEFLHGRRVGLFVRTGMTASFKFSSSVEMDIPKENSLRTERLLQEHFEQKNNFLLDAYANFGIRFGRSHKPNFRIELGVPFAVTQNLSVFKMRAGFGMKISLMIPLKVNKTM